ncbi:SDR family oxidoreductase [Botryobacter ruber]|uniref:SDR family oxidoreductase n=1 Tax=Botryobacter ruber TaxID=2171629 RepID=UPI000E0B689A|nr:SDR family oxidoreductase [Botryobacter ruber]
MRETILVTGATGTVGREIVALLSMLDVKVRAGVHSIIKGENLKRLPDVDIVEMEFAAPGSLTAAFTHVDRVMLITPFTENQVALSNMLVDEAVKAGVKHIVKLSIAGAEQETGVQVLQWHREAEAYIEASGIPYTFLRPAYFMQNYYKYFGDTIKKENAFYLPTGNAQVALVDSRDVATTAVAVLTGTGHEGKAYELTGPEAISNEQVAALLSQVTGREINYVEVPAEKAREAMVARHMPEKLADAMVELYSAYKAGFGTRVTNTVAEVSGREPYTFQLFAEDYKDCFSESETK